MANTPKSIKVDIDWNRVELVEALKDSYNEGLQEILEWLEYAYLEDPGRPDRGTPKAEAILEVARDATKFIKGKRK